MIQSDDPVGGPYIGNGVTTTFAYGIPVLAKTELIVTLTEIATEDETTLIVDTDYTVNGVGSDDDADWDITYPVSGSPMASTHRLVITPNIPLLQETDFANNGGFLPENHTAAFDRLTVIAQQQQAELDRAVKVTVGSTTDPNDLIADLEDAADAASSASAVASAAVAALGLGNAYASTTLTSGTTTLTFATSAIYERFTGTLSGAAIINLSRTGAVAGAKFELVLGSVVTTASNTLTIRENGAGSLVTLDTAHTVNGKVELIYTGSAWILWWKDLIKT
jgi:hypothetical protein